MSVKSPVLPGLVMLIRTCLPALVAHFTRGNICVRTTTTTNNNEGSEENDIRDRLLCFDDAKS